MIRLARPKLAFVLAVAEAGTVSGAACASSAAPEIGQRRRENVPAPADAENRTRVSESHSVLADPKTRSMHAPLRSTDSRNRLKEGQIRPRPRGRTGTSAPNMTRPGHCGGWLTGLHSDPAGWPAANQGRLPRTRSSMDRASVFGTEGWGFEIPPSAFWNPADSRVLASNVLSAVPSSPQILPPRPASAGRGDARSSRAGCFPDSTNALIIESLPAENLPHTFFNPRRPRFGLFGCSKMQQVGSSCPGVSASKAAFKAGSSSN